MVGSKNGITRLSLQQQVTTIKEMLGKRKVPVLPLEEAALKLNRGIAYTLQLFRATAVSSVNSEAPLTIYMGTDDEGRRTFSLMTVAWRDAIENEKREEGDFESAPGSEEAAFSEGELAERRHYLPRYPWSGGRLSPADFHKACIALRAKGFTIRDIAAMTGNRYPSVIRSHTDGCSGGCSLCRQSTIDVSLPRPREEQRTVS